MANRVVIFPQSKEAAARAYAAWTDIQWATITGDPGEKWSYVRNDIDGEWVVPYLGPPQTWGGNVVAEPAGGEVMRADGVIEDSAVWPPPD